MEEYSLRIVVAPSATTEALTAALDAACGAGDLIVVAGLHAPAPGDVVLGPATFVLGVEHAAFRIVAAVAADLDSFGGLIGNGVDALVPTDSGDTMLRLALRQALHAARRATSADRLTGELVTGVGHELRTPLTGVTGALELLREELERRPGGVADATVWLEMAERNAAALRRQVLDMLAVADADAATPADPVECAGTPVATVLADVAAHSGVGLDIEAANSGARVRMPAAQLTRVVAHLAAGLAGSGPRAASATPALTPSVRVRVRRSGRHVAILLTGSAPDVNGLGLVSHAAAETVRRAGGAAEYDAAVPSWHLVLPVPAAEADPVGVGASVSLNPLRAPAETSYVRPAAFGPAGR